jgi:hypothetical protein
MKAAELARCGTFIFGLVLGALAPGGPADAQTGQAALVPFSDFLEEVSGVAFRSYVFRPASRVRTAKSFEDMRQHLLEMYTGVDVRHSFLLATDVFDCVPILQQPTARHFGLQSIATEPPPMPSPGGSRPNSASAGRSAIQNEQLGPEQKVDAFGNSLTCEIGTIPMRRITLEELSRFETLSQYFQKGPDGAGQIRTPGGHHVPPADESHLYAHSYQIVANIGGSSDINLWNPSINVKSQEIFSLAQQWYSNMVGTDRTTLQTVEVGWQVYPQMYGSQTPHLFIFWTPNDYQITGPGCYNICPGFMQKDYRYMLGGPFQKTSVDGGVQYYFTLGYYLYKGSNCSTRFEHGLSA